MKNIKYFVSKYKFKILKNTFFIKFLFIFINIIFSKNIIYFQKIIINLKQLKYNIFQSRNYNLSLNNKKYYLYEYIKNYEDKYQYFNITSINYTFSIKFKITKIEYNIGFYDKNNNLIIPSDLSLYNNLHIFCNMNESYDMFVYSFANIYNNKYYNCIEYFSIKKKINFGINILKNEKDNINNNIYIFNNEIINYNYLNNIKDNEFDPLIVNNNYKNAFYDKTLNLKKLFLKRPDNSPKQNMLIKLNKWHFKNIYNNYFCFCKGLNCIIENIQQFCKYNLYLYIINNNKYLYNKTHYLFADFIFSSYSSDDTYPVFKKMKNLSLPVHYITEKIEIYNEYCNKFYYCNSIILVNKYNYVINGDFLEKYLTIFLKLKAVISGAEYYSLNNLFYNIDYITYISVGHGISLLKYFLYYPYNYYGNRIYNKILLPPSEIIISKAKECGWNIKDIIKINLPRWDRYSNITENSFIFKENEKITRNSIFVMFTWRQIKKNKKISYYYLNNIFNLITNHKLIITLKNRNFTLYFSFHHKQRNFENKFKFNNIIKYIYENDISNVLSKTNLVVSDFSSIIFDLICRKKPYIIFIPDANDPNIKKIYDHQYYEIIKSMKKDSFFKNKFFEVNEVINKIIYYINNNFKLEKKLEKFYEEFSFKKGHNIQDFIDYLLKLN